MAKLKKGDTVQILLGKDRGKSGQIERIIRSDGQVLITGINVSKRHVGKKVTGAEGGIIDIIKPVDVSNVALVCPECKKPTRVGFRITDEEKIRICKKCGKEITK